MFQKLVYTCTGRGFAGPSSVAGSFGSSTAGSFRSSKSNLGRRTEELGNVAEQGSKSATFEELRVLTVGSPHGSGDS